MKWETNNFNSVFLYIMYGAKENRREEQPTVVGKGDILITKYSGLPLKSHLPTIFTQQYVKYPEFYLQWITDTCDNDCQIIIAILMLSTLLRVSNYVCNDTSKSFVKVFTFFYSFSQYNLQETFWTF